MDRCIVLTFSFLPSSIECNTELGSIRCVLCCAFRSHHEMTSKIARCSCQMRHVFRCDPYHPSQGIWGNILKIHVRFFTSQILKVLEKHWPRLVLAGTLPSLFQPFTSICVLFPGKFLVPASIPEASASVLSGPVSRVMGVPPGGPCQMCLSVDRR